MTTIPRGHWAYLQRARNAKLLAGLTPDPAPTPHPTSHFEFPNPTDLRGIPAIGMSVPGHIRGTQPENAVTR